ncbi:MAG: hypothetical protein ACJA2W_003579 [Planctomycetota bacterium]|jgi:hypothetical protein
MAEAEEKRRVFLFGTHMMEEYRSRGRDVAAPSFPFGKIVDLKHSSRIPVLVAVVTGVFLVAFGLFQSSGKNDGPAPATIGQPEDGGGGALTTTPAAESDGSLDLLGPRIARGDVDADADLPPSEVRETALSVLISYTPDGAPVVGLPTSLWRQQTGEGPSFRPARRLTELVTGDDGRVRFIVTPDAPLEIHAGARGIARASKLLIGPLRPAEERSVVLQLERPPDPVELTIRDSVTGDPIAGVAVRSVSTDPTHLGLEDFPGTTQLIKRTDAEGRANLPGAVREAHWILVDAAGYSPTALKPSSLEGRLSAGIQLERAAKLNVEAADPTGAPLHDVEVACEVSLGGYRTTFTMKTNRRGEASFARVPAGVPMVLKATLSDAVPTLFDAVTLKPLEERTVRIELSRQ